MGRVQNFADPHRQRSCAPTGCASIHAAASVKAPFVLLAVLLVFAICNAPDTTRVVRSNASCDNSCHFVGAEL